MLEGRFKSTCVQPAGMQQLSSAGHTHTPKALIGFLYTPREREREKAARQKEKGHCFFSHENSLLVSVGLLFLMPKQGYLTTFTSLTEFKLHNMKKILAFSCIYDHSLMLMEGQRFTISQPWLISKDVAWTCWSFITDTKTTLFQYLSLEDINMFNFSFVCHCPMHQCQTKNIIWIQSSLKLEKFPDLDDEMLIKVNQLTKHLMQTFKT